MLFEILGALAITGLIGLVVTMANLQVIDQTSRNNDYTTASRHTLNALHWIACDTQGAQTINGTTGFPLSEDLVLRWTDWDNSEHEITYTVVNGQLKRSYSIDGADPSELLIAEYINPAADMSSCTSDNGVLTLKITASVGEGSGITNVTKVRQIASRANL